MTSAVAQVQRLKRSRYGRPGSTDAARDAAQHPKWYRALLAFEPLVGELERLAVLGNRAHDLFGGAVRDLRLDLQGHGHVGTHQPGEMRYHFIGNLAGIAADARSVEIDGAVKTL